MKKVFRETSYMRSPAGNKSPALAQDAQKPARLPEEAANRKSHHTRTQNPGIRASERVHCLARLVRIPCRMPTSHTQSMAFGAGAPLIPRAHAQGDKMRQQGSPKPPKRPSCI
jgi:hypothetical protein